MVNHIRLSQKPEIILKKFKIIFHNHGFISTTLGSPKKARRYFLKALVVGLDGDPSCTNTTFVFLLGCI